MTIARNRAVRLAAKVRLGFAMIESALAEGVTFAQDEGKPGLADHLRDVGVAVQATHAIALGLAQPVADHFDEDVELFSGGTEDKNQPDPPPAH